MTLRPLGPSVTRAASIPSVAPLTIPTRALSCNSTVLAGMNITPSCHLVMNSVRANHHDGGRTDRLQSKHHAARCNGTLVQLTIFMKFAWRARMIDQGDLDLFRRLFNVNQINQPFAGARTGATLAMIAIILGAIGMLPASRAWSAATCRPQHQPLQLAAGPASPLAQDSRADDNKDVPTNQVDKYISVYESMQKDHNLTVDQATSKQGLTVAQFREIEGKIERDDTLRERVRKALRHEKDKDAAD